MNWFLVVITAAMSAILGVAAYAMHDLGSNGLALLYAGGSVAVWVELGAFLWWTE